LTFFNRKTLYYTPSLFLSKFGNPMSNIVNPNTAQPAITPVIGILVPLLKNPTNAAAKEPKPICIAPINADAVPASFLKGDIDKAAEFGKLNP
jgi:hypothetical protein